MRDFKPRDFDGSGQYLVRTTKDHVVDTGFLTTIMVKVGYDFGDRKENRGHTTYLIAVSDGLVYEGFSGNSVQESKQALCDNLNSEETQEYRFATPEELLRVASYNAYRCGKR